MKPITKLLILFVCVFVCDALHAQNIKIDLPSVTQHSPEGTSVTKYANYPHVHRQASHRLYSV